MMELNLKIILYIFHLQACLDCKGKLITAGIGKSAFIAQVGQSFPFQKYLILSLHCLRTSLATSYRRK